MDLVLPEASWEQKVHDITVFKVNAFVMGNDWKRKFDFLRDYCSVVYIDRTPEISTTKINGALEKRVR